MINYILLIGALLGLTSVGAGAYVDHVLSQAAPLGSCLHKTSEGMWLAYSRWPDKATRDASWPGENAPSDVLPDEIKKAIVKIQNCIDQTQKLPEICMEVG